jgi:RimJ/RimL family protein N-acetyltransferase
VTGSKASTPAEAGEGASDPALARFETSRLVLAPPTLADFEDSAHLWGDAEVTRHIGGKPSTRHEAWARLLRHAGHWAMLGFGYWAVRDRASGAFVGEVGFADFRRGLGDRFDGFPEAGWVLLPEAQGKGLATEAVLGALDWAERRLGPRRTVCMIHPDNAASLRVATKAGFERFAEAAFNGAPSVLLEREAGR